MSHFSLLEMTNENYFSYYLPIFTLQGHVYKTVDIVLMLFVLLCMEGFSGKQNIHPP